MKIAMLAALALGACAMDSPGQNVLPHDTYYEQDGYIGTCGSNVPPQWCIPKLSLCSTGKYQLLEGDVVTYGDYYLDNQTAIASGDYRSFTFDLSSRVMVDQGSSTTSPPWTVVTFVGDLDCQYAPP